ncbi:cyclic nucleotide-binding domain-containing protein [bacterium]|nr:cyclic nucleotide-binding domain-containing protein [bacterium]
MNIYTIAFIGKDTELYDIITQNLKSYEFSYFTFENLEKFIEFTAKNIANLIILSTDSENISKTEEFKKILIHDDRNIPVFVFSKPALYYSHDKDFEKNLVENIKKALQQNVLPRKQSEFGVIKLGKGAKLTTEKRDTPRLKTSVPFALYTDVSRSQKFLASLRDISAGGFSVNSKEALPEQDEFWCAFSIEDGENYILKAVKLRTVRAKDHWHTALRFSKISHADYSRINTYAKIIYFLKKTRIFEEFSDDDLRFVVKAGKKIFVSGGSMVFSENVEGRNFYIVLSGKIKISQRTGVAGANSEKYLATMHRGEFFGEMALLKEMKRSAGAQALTDSVLFKIDKSHLEQILVEHKDIAIKLYRAFISAFIERLLISNQALIDSPFSIPLENTKF